MCVSPIQIPQLAFYLYLFITYPSTCPPPINQFILFLWCISKKVIDINKLLPKYFNILNNILVHFSHQYLNCDHFWWMAYVFKIAVQRQDLEIRPLQRNRNIRIESLIVAHAEWPQTLCVHMDPKTFPLVPGSFFYPLSVAQYQCEQCNFLQILRLQLLELVNRGSVFEVFL